MKLLIACDDETDLQVMVDDLQRAGLDPHSQAVVLSVADLLPVPRAAATTSALPAAAARASGRGGAQQARRTAELPPRSCVRCVPGWSAAEAQPTRRPAIVKNRCMVARPTSSAPKTAHTGRSCSAALRDGVDARRPSRASRACAAGPTPQRLPGHDDHLARRRHARRVAQLAPGCVRSRRTGCQPASTLTQRRD
jgi:hypothetical protein